MPIYDKNVLIMWICSQCLSCKRSLATFITIVFQSNSRFMACWMNRTKFWWHHGILCQLLCTYTTYNSSEKLWKHSTVNRNPLNPWPQMKILTPLDATSSWLSIHSISSKSWATITTTSLYVNFILISLGAAHYFEYILLLLLVYHVLQKLNSTIQPMDL